MVFQGWNIYWDVGRYAFYLAIILFIAAIWLPARLRKYSQILALCILILAGLLYVKGWSHDRRQIEEMNKGG